MRQKYKEVYKEFLDEYPGCYTTTVEELNENGEVVCKIAESFIRISKGTEFVSGYTEKKCAPETDGNMWSPSLVKNKDGEWCIYSEGTIFPMTEENIKIHRAAHLKKVLDGQDPEVEKKLRSLPGLLAKSSAFATKSGGRGTFIVVGRNLVHIGCDKGFDMLEHAGVINKSGGFSNVKLTDKRLKSLNVKLHDKVLEDLLELVSK